MIRHSSRADFFSKFCFDFSVFFAEIRSSKENPERKAPDFHGVGIRPLPIFGEHSVAVELSADSIAEFQLIEFHATHHIPVGYGIKN